MAGRKQFTRAEVSAKNNKEEAVFIVDNLVYDVTAFQEEHPGGHEVLQAILGKDASQEFDDIGHSLEAKEMMKKYQIGEIVEAEKTKSKNSKPVWSNVKEVDTSSSFVSSWKFPLILGIVVAVFYNYLFE